MRLTAAKAIAKIGCDLKSVIPALIELLKEIKTRWFEGRLLRS